MMPMSAPPGPAAAPPGPAAMTPPAPGGQVAGMAAGMPDLSQLTPQQLQMLMALLAAGGGAPQGPPPGIPQPTVGGAPPQGILAAADQPQPAGPPANTSQAISQARSKKAAAREKK